MIVKTDEVTLLKVADGYVNARDPNTKVWWHCADGPCRVEVSKHRDNIDEFPNVYSIQKPKYRIETIYHYEPFYD